MIKLNVGCGADIIPGWINIDRFTWKEKGFELKDGAQVMADALELPFPDNSVDELLTCHVLEHFHFFDGFKALKEWYRVLKIGGVMTIELPNFLEACKQFVSSNEQDRVSLYAQLFGEPWIPGHVHLFGYTKTQLLWSLQCVGFKNPIEEPALRFYNQTNICMKFKCHK